jgi:hypothetical protein
VPTTAQLELGELAINTTDGKLFLKRNNGTESIVEVGAVGGTLAVANGGTGATTFTSGKLLVGQGTSAITSSLIGDDGTTVTIDNIAVAGGSINSTSVGATTASTGAFTTLSGSGAVTFGSSVGFNSLTAAMSLGGNHTTGVFTIGGATGTGILTIGRSTLSQTTNIQAGATASGSTKTINIGTGGLTGSTTTVTIGSGSSTTTVGISGSLTTTGNIAALTGTGRTLLATDSGGSISIGRVDGVASAPFIDFNSGATAVDFDARIAAGGGTGTAGQGTLTLTAASTAVTGVLSTSLGSAAAPSYTFTGDTNTGMWSPAADTIAFSEGGVEAMRIDSTGNVGIGNVSPGYKLSVTGTAEITAAKEGVFTITDGATVNLDPNNGSIQSWTLGASRTPGQANWATGQSMTLMIDDGTAFAVTWTTLGVVWKTNAGVAPTLATTGFSVIVLWKVGSTIYGARVGDA